MSGLSAGLVQSVQTRLVRNTKEIGVDPNLVLTRYAIERLLYRLSVPPYCEQFVLKGALLLLVWLGETIRPTRDADLLGFGDLSDDALVTIFRTVCAAQVEPGGMEYLPDELRITDIRPKDAYGGKRPTLQPRLGPVRLHPAPRSSIGAQRRPEAAPALLLRLAPRAVSDCPDAPSPSGCPDAPGGGAWLGSGAGSAA
jgi:hypothetical protein